MAKSGPKPVIGKKSAPQYRPKTPAFLSDRKDGINAKLSEVLNSHESPVDIEEISLEFYNQVGGAKGFVTKVIAAYNLARLGSAEQARLLDIMTDLFKLASAKRGTAEMDQASDEELEAIAMTLAKKSGLLGMPIQDYPDHVCI